MHSDQGRGTGHVEKIKGYKGAKGNFTDIRYSFLDVILNVCESRASSDIFGSPPTYNWPCEWLVITRKTINYRNWFSKERITNNDVFCCIKPVFHFNRIAVKRTVF